MRVRCTNCWTMFSDSDADANKHHMGRHCPPLKVKGDGIRAAIEHGSLLRPAVKADLRSAREIELTKENEILRKQLNAIDEWLDLAPAGMFHDLRAIRKAAGRMTSDNYAEYEKWDLEWDPAIRAVFIGRHDANRVFCGQCFVIDYATYMMNQTEWATHPQWDRARAVGIDKAVFDAAFAFYLSKSGFPIRIERAPLFAAPCPHDWVDDIRGERICRKCGL